MTCKIEIRPVLKANNLEINLGNVDICQLSVAQLFVELTTRLEGHFDLHESFITVGQHIFGLSRINTSYAQQQVPGGAQRQFHLKYGEMIGKWQTAGRMM